MDYEYQDQEAEIFASERDLYQAKLEEVRRIQAHNDDWRES
jgi:hypothetical protein